MRRMFPRIGMLLKLDRTIYQYCLCRRCVGPAFPRKVTTSTSASKSRGEGWPYQKLGRDFGHACYSVDSLSKPLLPSYIDASNIDIGEALTKDITVIEDFVSEEEEQALVAEVEPHLKRMRYQKDHWDDAIHSYRETERMKWRDMNKPVIERIRKTAFPEGEPQIAYVHVLDLAADGHIKPHVDSVRFCGTTIAGISLLSPSVMRFVHETDLDKRADVLLKQRSLYIMRGRVRYEYTHEILKSETSVFKGEPVPKGRRISIICRTEVDPARSVDPS